MSETTALQTRNKQQATALAELRDMLERSKSRLAEVAPKHLTPDRMVRIALAATSREPKLLQCSPQSILKSVMKAAQLGLEPGGALGEGYLVPFRNKHTKKLECEFIAGYRGLITLARRSGQILSVEAHAVYAKDGFDYRVTDERTILTHQPCWDDERGALVRVYAIARMRDTPLPQIEVMTRKQVDGIRARSQSGASDFSPWRSDFDEMARKTVVRRICKYLPLSPEAREAMEVADKVEGSTAVSAAEDLFTFDEDDTETPPDADIVDKPKSDLDRLTDDRRKTKGGKAPAMGEDGGPEPPISGDREPGSDG